MLPILYDFSGSIRSLDNIHVCLQIRVHFFAREDKFYDFLFDAPYKLYNAIWKYSIIRFNQYTKDNKSRNILN